MAHELVADAEFDSMVFEGLTGVTRAMHMCRGNAPGGMWAADRGLRGDLEGRLPAPEEPRPAAPRVRLGPRGHFEPLADVLPHHEVVLGLVTTKDGALEDPEDLVARIEEATHGTCRSSGWRSARSAASPPA